MSTKMIAVTIGVGKKHEMLAALAAASCARRTGLEVRILGGEAMRKYNVARPHHLKFKIFDEFPDAEDVLYFDADMIFLKDFDARPFAGSRELIAVRDIKESGSIAADARNIGIAVDDYFNSGFMVLNRTHHHDLLRRADKIDRTFASPFYDQTSLNAARHQLGIPLRMLPKEFNYLEFENVGRPKDIVIAHVSDIERRPDETIRRYHQFWARDGAAGSEDLRSAKERVAGRFFEYDRVGHDARRMELRTDGSIGTGAAGCEKRWEMTVEGGEIVLWIIAGYQPTCALTEDEKGVWTGRWMRFEQMPIRLSPISARSASRARKPVEVVLLNWRRPANIPKILDAFESQRDSCSITLIDAAASPETTVDQQTRARADRLFVLSENFGPVTRFMPPFAFLSPFTYFHDDDMIPGPQAVRRFLSFAEQHPEFGVLGQDGRLVRNGRCYAADQVQIQGEFREVDFVVRGYFVRQPVLPALFAWYAKLGLAEVREDDILLCSAARQAGYKVAAVRPQAPEEKMNHVELPSPYAMSAKSNHIDLRTAFVQHLRRSGWRSLGESASGDEGFQPLETAAR